MSQMIRTTLLISVLLTGLAVPSVGLADPGGPRPEVRYATRTDTSQPLREMPARPPQAGRKVLPPKLIPNQPAEPAAPFTDPVVQEEVAPNAAAFGFNFEGINNRNGVLPPDTNGDVGPNHYVQMVNLSLAVWTLNRSTHSAILVYGPVNANQIWAGFGGPCQTTNDGDPIVLYDQLADRWLVSQFALPNYPLGPFYECIAVSKTPDPTGAWHRYQFLISNTKMNDYPKLGVWPDGYYMAVNQFNQGSFSWGGQGVVAFERSAMLTGGNARMVYFDMASNGSLAAMLPADLDGTTLPPAGAPDYFAQKSGSNRLLIWGFHVDWNNPASSTFTSVRDITVATFDSSMCGSRNCIPQPGTGAGLDAISDRLMHRLQYRNFGAHQAMVVNHTVDVNASDRAGIRWYELRDSGSGWTLAQQGTFSPDSTDRWMASAAMNGAGDIALGYSISSGSIYPSIRVTGRLAGDPTGQMTQGENTVMAGSGSQTSTYYRWGDYSMMSVDPVDDCTFWYTNEYMTTTGGAPWRTRIASFQLGSCSAPDTPPTVSITNPADGATVFGTVSVTATATDDNGVTQVAFFVDGGSIGVDANAGDGWSTDWDTTAYADGAHTITATATDSIGQTWADSISITLDNINELPVAGFTYSCSGLTCSFDGSGSTDPDGTIDSYAWNFGDDATGSGATASHTYAAAGTYSAVLTVTDNRGGTDSDTQDVIATTGPTTLHVGDLDGASAPGSRGRWDAGVTITVLDADEGLVADATVSGAWSAGATGGASCTTDGSGQCTVWKNNIKSNVTSVTFTVGDVAHASLVYDSGSNVDPDDDSDGTLIVVYQNGPPPNQPPTASFTFSCADLSCNFDGSGSSDPDGSVVAYDWDFGDAEAGSGPTTSHDYAGQGSYTVVLTVTDDGGATGTTSQAVPVGITLPTMHVADMVGNGAPGSRGRWIATVTITVRDSTDATAVANATVSGSWGGGASGGASCDTDDSGSCEVTKANIKSNVASVTFTVTDVTSTQYTYEPKGTDVTTITVPAP